MKRKFSKILGVGLTVALITSLLLTASPVLAGSVSKPAADTTPDEISVKGVYTISYRINKVQTVNDTITVRFPVDTDVTGATVAGGTGVSYTSGIGFASGNANTVGVVPTKADRTVVITMTGLTTGSIGAMAYVQVVIGNVTNPTEPGAYTLDVKTSDETDYIESESYDIDAPVVGGFVYVYNPSDILMATYGGSAALNAASGDYVNKDFTVKVGPGTYTLTGAITLSGENLVFESSAGAADTIIKAATHGIIVSGKKVTLDGFTIDDAGTAVSVTGLDDVITNCVITDATVTGIAIAATVDIDTTVSDNVIEDCAAGITFAAGAPTDLGDVDITGNTITEANTLGAIVFAGGNVDIDITGNTITDNEVSGIYFADGAQACDDITISGNTISANDDHGIEIVEDTQVPTKLVIRENDIIDNKLDGMNILGWTALTDVIIFNNFSGNTSDNIETTVAITNAIFNWWGSAVKADITDEFSGAGAVTYDPWLVDTQEAVASGSKVATNASSLDAKDAAGVKVSGVADDTTPADVADIISAARYVANPEGAIDDAIAFYDVYVALNTACDPTKVTAKLKFYDSAITTGSTASFWTGDFWAECSDMEARDGIIYVTVTDDTLPAIDELEETIFAVVAGEAVTAFGAPVLLAPAVGADDVSLTPTFAWGAVTDAIGYDFEFADNANFVTPMVKLDGELGRLIVTAYAYVGELPYSTAYYWRVKAVSADAESDWASSVFITMDEPEEPTPPVVIEPYEPPEIIIEQPDIIVESPDVIVPLPAVAAPITPSWIYVIIGVGAVLVIALLVLIVRTRRVA